MTTIDSIEFELTGNTALIMHNARLSDPMDPTAKQIKKYTSKRKKSDEDHAAIARLEWEGSLYHDDELGPYIPGENIDAMLVESAKLQRRGKDIQRAVFCPEQRISLAYDGPRDLERLWAKGFWDRRTVRVQSARTVRCRPCFRDWSLKFSVAFHAATMNREDLIAIMKTAGAQVGLCDYRPRYGRFDVETK